MATTEEMTVRKKSDTQIATEKKKLKAFLRAVLPESYDKYDVEAKFDSSLTYLENKEAVIDEIKDLFSGEFRGSTLKEQAEKVKCEQEKVNKDRDEAIEREILDYNKRNYVDNAKLD